MSKPDFEQEIWEIIYLARNNFGEAEEIVKQINKKLERIWDAGYRYAVVNDWVIVQEEQYAKQDDTKCHRKSQHNDVISCPECGGFR